MTPDQIFILVTGIAAALLGAGALLAAARRRRDADGAPGGAIAARPDPQADKYELPPADLEALSGTSYGTAVRVLWWVSIALVLIGIGLSDAYESTRSGIYLLGAAAVAIVFLVHDLLPARLRTRGVAVVEVLAALAIITALLTLTGFGTSPFAYAYALVAVAVALAAASRVGALLVAAGATLAFLGVLWVDPARDDYGSRELLSLGLTIGSIWLLAYLASVFASAERTIRGAVEKMSRIDSLTGLFNSSQLYPMLEQEVQRTRRSARGFCLLMIDLDGLKAVNDTYGHHRGDEVLRALGAVIRGSIRNLDAAYRLHGDEFMVLLPETDIPGAFVVAEKVRIGAEEVGLVAGSVEMLTSVSIGLVSCPEDGTTADELMLAADRAMYQAKSLGKNQVSGNPRPRRLLYRAAEEPAGVQATVAAVPVEPSVEEQAGEERAAEVPVEPDLGFQLDAPVVVPLPPPLRAAAEDSPGDNHTDEDEPDPSEVRRHIAAASRNLDPDYQIRRAMDAFLSPTRTNGE